MYVKSTAVALMVAVNSASAGVMYKESVMKQDPDFGLCLPTMKFEGGLGGRPAMDFTFLPTDPLCARGQQEASNPNIISNRICDQLSTICGANTAAVNLCRESSAKIRVLGTKDKSTADTWNTLMGFGYALTNPDGGAAVPGAVKDLKKKRDLTEVEKRQSEMIYCSTTEWLDDCTGWPGPPQKREEPAAPVVKREEPVAAAPVVKKRDVSSPASDKVEKRQTAAVIPMIYCSTTEWLDDCTGWP